MFETKAISLRLII